MFLPSPTRERARAAGPPPRRHGGGGGGPGRADPGNVRSETSERGRQLTFSLNKRRSPRFRREARREGCGDGFETSKKCAVWTAADGGVH